MSRIIDIDPLSKEWITFDYNHIDDSFTIGHHQDCDAILDDNKAAQSETDLHKKQAVNEWAHYAKVPNIVVLEWRQKYGVDFFNKDHWAGVMRLINSPEYSHLKRTSYYHDR